MYTSRDLESYQAEGTMSRPCYAYYWWILIGKKDSAIGRTSTQNRYRDAMNGYCDGVLQHVQSSSRQEVPSP
jgi:hypothetical protein